MAKLVSKTYGDALFELSVEKNNVDAVSGEISFVRQVLREHAELSELLDHPKISREEKINVIENIFKGRLSDDVVAILVLIVEKGRHTELDSIFDYFEDRVREYKNIGVAYVTTPMELSEEMKNKIINKLKEITSYTSFEMHYGIDKGLIGGMVIRIGDHVIDSSLRTKLENMSRNLSRLQLQ